MNISRLLVILTIAILAGCPTLPAPSNCAPNSTRCHNGTPQVCSHTKRWTPVADEPCARSESTCCAIDGDYGRVHACVMDTRECR